MKSSNDDQVFLKETEALHNLRALEEIEKNPQISQRELSLHLGVALGITNALLKTLVRKGLIKIRGKNNRSLTYHLTHAGVLAKSALAVKWTLNTVDFYRQARRDMADRLAVLVREGVKTIAVYGADEMAEILVMVASEVGLSVAAIVDRDDTDRQVLLGIPVLKPDVLAGISVDALVVCRFDDAGLAQVGRFIDAETKIFKLV